MSRPFRGRCAIASPVGLIAVVFLIALAFPAAGLTVLGCDDPMAGSAGIGDPYLPWAGNGGYEVAHYDIALQIDPADRFIEGHTAVQATALQELESFHLDLAGLKVGAVSVDGRAAEYWQKDEELVVTCPELLKAGDEFIVEVDYSGEPEAVLDVESYTVGWQQVGDTVYTLDEPLGAATWYPANDHPSDKATYTFRLTVPKPYVAAATGVLVDTEVQGTDRTFVWEMRQPLASYLAAVSIGNYVVQESTAPNGVPIRNYFAPELAEVAEAAFARTGEALAFYEEMFGPYPFEAYGVVVPDAETGAAMENQTLSLFGRDVVVDLMSDAIVGQMFLSHELAHQWFGDSVTISAWEDIWLNEGFATYASWLWLEHDRGPQLLEAMVHQSLQGLKGDAYPPLGRPGVEGVFSENVYQRGALTLHALRLTVGDDVFFKILREWASRYQYANVATDDFIALVRELAPEVPAWILTALFDCWLYQEELPTLPGAGS